jgi:hypothetical protein
VRSDTRKPKRGDAFTCGARPFFVQRNKDQAVFLVAVALALFLWTGDLVVICDFMALEDGGRAGF